MEIGYFLGGVAGIIWNPTINKYLLVRRSMERDFQPEVWECVTGRVNQGESFEQALNREIMEEVGVLVQIEFIVATTHFFRGDPTAENELLGLVFYCILRDQKNIRLDWEHSEFRWLSVEEIDDLLPDGNWLKQAIHRAETQRRLLPEELRALYREEGFSV